MTGKVTGVRIRWNEVNDRKLMVLALGNPHFDFAAIATYFDGPAGVPASAKAIEERLAKLKREGRGIAAETGAVATSSTTPAKIMKKPAAVTKAPGTKRKAHPKTEDSEEEDDEEIVLDETDEEDEPPAPPAKKTKSSKTAAEDKAPAKKTKSGKKDKEDKPSAKKAKTTERAKIAPTGPKRVAYSDDEGNKAQKEGENVEAMEIDSSSEESDGVKREET